MSVHVQELKCIDVGVKGDFGAQLLAPSLSPELPTEVGGCGISKYISATPFFFIVSNLPSIATLHGNNMREIATSLLVFNAANCAWLASHDQCLSGASSSTMRPQDRQMNPFPFSFYHADRNCLVWRPFRLRCVHVERRPTIAGVFKDGPVD